MSFQLFPDKIFQQVFNRVLRICVDKGVVNGHTHCIDSFPVKAKALMGSGCTTVNYVVVYTSEQTKYQINCFSLHE